MPKYSQVFLKDVRMCERIADALAPDDYKCAVEIGPGKGALTQFLRPLWGDRLSVVEIDPVMAGRINEKFPGLTIKNVDFLTVDLTGSFPDVPVAFVGNLPYECSTAILMKVLAFPGFGGAAFMFQREVADKISAATGDPDYGYLSVAVQAQSEVSLLAQVPAGSFSPVPEVDSTVLIFRPLKTFTGAQSLGPFLTFVKQAFSHRRKTLLNSLAMGRCLDKGAVEALLTSSGFDPRLRPQNLSVNDYLKLSEAFASAGH